MDGSRARTDSRSRVASRAGLALTLALCACGDDTAAVAPPSRPTEPSLPDPVRDELASPSSLGAVAASDGVVEVATPSPGATAAPLPSLQLLGAERTRLLFLDVEREPWDVESVDVSIVAGVHEAIFLGCGTRAAVRTEREVAVFERAGGLVGRAPLPALVSTLGARLAAVLDPLGEEYGVEPDAAAMVGVGPLVRTAEGAIAMDPTLDLAALYGEEEGCRSRREELRVELAVPGVEAAPCEAAGLEELPLGRQDAPPAAGWRCAFVSAEDRTEPAWLTHLPRLLHAVASRDDDACEEPEAGDAWAHFVACRPDSPGLAICRAPDDATTLVGVLPADAMGCVGGPDLYAFRGTTLRAHAGTDGSAWTVAGVWIYGGDRRWFVDAAGRAEPVSFGRIRPDAVRGDVPAPAAPEASVPE